MPYTAGSCNDIGDTGKYYIREGCVLAQRYYYYPGTGKLSALGTRAENNGTVSNSGRAFIYWCTLTNYCINHIYVCLQYVCGYRDVLRLSTFSFSRHRRFAYSRQIAPWSRDCEATSSTEVACLHRILHRMYCRYILYVTCYIARFSKCSLNRRTDLYRHVTTLRPTFCGRNFDFETGNAIT